MGKDEQGAYAFVLVTVTLAAMTLGSVPSVLPGAAGATGQEITQQPVLWRRMAPGAGQRRAAVAEFLAPVTTSPDARIVLTGAGSSAFIGDLLAPALARSMHRRVDAVATTDVVADPRSVFAEDVPTVLVSFARSGDSPESLAATRLADECLTEVRHVVVTCNPGGALARAHDAAPGSLVLLTPAESHDRGFAMTSSFTCMLLETWLALDPSVDAALVEQVADAAERVLAERTDAVAALAAQGHERVVYLGSGPLAGLAHECSLKLLELSGGAVVSFHDSALGFRHGPKSVVDGRTLTVVLTSGDEHTRRYDADIATELRAGSGTTLVLGTRPDGTSDELSWCLPGLAGVPDVGIALVYLVAAQLYAVQVSLRLGITPDDPSPSGTVNRVVQGVTIHELPAASA